MPTTQTLPPTLRSADERFMITEAITPMEHEIFDQLTRKHGLNPLQLQFRQRVTAYHLRYSYWKQLPLIAFADVVNIISKHGYTVAEFQNIEENQLPRFSYDFTHLKS